jgi:hypothetical protein
VSIRVTKSLRGPDDDVASARKSVSRRVESAVSSITLAAAAEISLAVVPVGQPALADTTSPHNSHNEEGSPLTPTAVHTSVVDLGGNDEAEMESVEAMLSDTDKELEISEDEQRHAATS